MTGVSLTHGPVQTAALAAAVQRWHTQAHAAALRGGHEGKSFVSDTGVPTKPGFGDALACNTRFNYCAGAGRGAVDLDVTQGLPISQLRKSGEELVQAREILDLVFGPVVGRTAAKRAERQMEHELRKYELAFVHGFWRKSRKKLSLAFDVQIETRLKHHIWQVNH